MAKNKAGGAPAPAKPSAPPEPARKKPPAPQPASKPAAERDTDAELLSIEWSPTEAWCGDKVKLKGKSKGHPNGKKIAASIAAKGGKKAGKAELVIAGDAFEREWKVVDVLPEKKGDHFQAKVELEAKAEDVATPKLLGVHVIPTVAKKPHKDGRVHFDVAATDFVIHVTSDVHFVKGWAGEVVKLPAAASTGKLDGKLVWNGYSWMKTVRGKKKYWDGTAWKALPRGFVLADSNHFAVGFYKNGDSFTCQYGGDWPEKFKDWDIDKPKKKAKIAKWEKNIKDTWTRVFDIKRDGCDSTAKACCRYEVRVTVKFVKESTFKSEHLVVADGDIRSNDSLFFLGEARIAVAAHEFGHHFGNPDEYAGAKVDTSLNDDGARNGIDADSIMGQNLTKVKKRHFKTLCKVFEKMVNDEFGRPLKYKAVPR